MWEILLGMERFNGEAEEEYQALGLGLGPGKGARAGQSSCGVGQGNALQLPKEDPASAMRVLRAPASAVRRMCGGAAADHYGHLARVEVELLASTFLCYRMH